MVPSWFGASQAALDVSPGQIAKSVLIFLGIPLLAGWATRRYGERLRGRQWYETAFLPPDRALGALRPALHHRRPLRAAGRPDHLPPARRGADRHTAAGVLRPDVGAGHVLGRPLGLSYERTTTLAFTAAGNNFELAIAVAIATFGVSSGQALAGVVGPFIEVPALVGLVYVSLWLRRRFPGPAPVGP